MGNFDSDFGYVLSKRVLKVVRTFAESHSETGVLFASSQRAVSRCQMSRDLCLCLSSFKGAVKRRTSCIEDFKVQMT